MDCNKSTRKLCQVYQLLSCGHIGKNMADNKTISMHKITKKKALSLTAQLLFQWLFPQFFWIIYTLCICSLISVLVVQIHLKFWPWVLTKKTTMEFSQNSTRKTQGRNLVSNLEFSSTSFYCISSLRKKQSQNWCLAGVSSQTLPDREIDVLPNNTKRCLKGHTRFHWLYTKAHMSWNKEHSFTSDHTPFVWEVKCQ